MDMRQYLKLSSRFNKKKIHLEEIHSDVSIFQQLIFSSQTSWGNFKI